MGPLLGDVFEAVPENRAEGTGSMTTVSLGILREEEGLLVYGLGPGLRLTTTSCNSVNRVQRRKMLVALTASGSRATLYPLPARPLLTQAWQCEEILIGHCLLFFGPFLGTDSLGPHTASEAGSTSPILQRRKFEASEIAAPCLFCYSFRARVYVLGSSKAGSCCIFPLPAHKTPARAFSPGASPFG